MVIFSPPSWIRRFQRGFQGLPQPPKRVRADEETLTALPVVQDRSEAGRRPPGGHGRRQPLLAVHHGAGEELSDRRQKLDESVVGAFAVSLRLLGPFERLLYERHIH